MSPRRAGLLIVAAAACGDPELEIVAVEGERIDVHHEASFQLCAGTVAAYDRGIVSVAAQLGLDPDDFEHMTFTWLDAESYEAESPFYFDDAGGWAWGSKSYGKLPYLFHEVVHMISQQEVYDVNVLLLEGLATAFEENGGLNLLVRDRSERVDPRPFIGKRHGEMNYEVAGHFVSYLLGRHGPERFWELYRENGYLGTAGRFRRRFRDIYGLELDAAVDDFLNNDECPEDALPIPLPPSCEAPEIPWRDDVWVAVRTLHCSDEDVAGGQGTLFSAEFAATLTIPETGRYRIADASDSGVGSVLTRCGGCPWLNVPLVLAPELEVELEAGRYSLVSSSWDASRPLLAVGITKAPD